MPIQAPDRSVHFYTLEELKEKLHFTYLSQIAFETPLDLKEIRQRGFDARKQNRVDIETEKFEIQFKEKITSRYTANVSIGWINETIGYGVFAEEELPKGSYVGEYTGIIRKNDLRRCFEPLNNYCVTYPIVDELGKNFFLDGKDFGNVTRFINHSYTPNLRFYNVFDEGFYHRIFLTERHIKKGEQLLFNYGKGYWNARTAPLEITLDESSLKGVSFYCFKNFDKGQR